MLQEVGWKEPGGGDALHDPRPSGRAVPLLLVGFSSWQRAAGSVVWGGPTCGAQSSTSVGDTTPPQGFGARPTLTLCGSIPLPGPL